MTARWVSTSVLSASLLVCAVRVRPSEGDNAVALAHQSEGRSSDAPSFTARLVPPEAGAKSVGFAFEITRVSDRSQFAVRLANRTTRVDQYVVVNDRLVVLGQIASLADTVTILPLSGKEGCDFFLCYEPKLSESRRYLIYRKFYPRFSPSEVQSDLVLIYDLLRPSAANRVGGATGPLDCGGSDDVTKQEDVGVPVFPQGNRSSANYQVWVPEARERWEILTARQLTFGSPGTAVDSSSTYRWLDCDEHVVFVARQAEDNWVVGVELDGAAKARWRVVQTKIDLLPILNLRRGQSNYSERLAEAKKRVAIAAIEPNGPARMRIHLVRRPEYKTDSVDVALNWTSRTSGCSGSGAGASSHKTRGVK